MPPERSAPAGSAAAGDDGVGSVMPARSEATSKLRWSSRPLAAGDGGDPDGGGPGEEEPAAVQPGPVAVAGGEDLAQPSRGAAGPPAGPAPAGRTPAPS